MCQNYEDNPLLEEQPINDERYIETATATYVARESPDGSGWVVWTADYERLVGCWPEFGDARVDLNMGVNMLGGD